jgi:hypothetical protein
MGELTDYAVVEWIVPNDPAPKYKVIPISIDKNATFLNEGNHGFELYGKTDFDKISMYSRQEIRSGLASMIGSLAGNLDTPRSIITKDGKIFMNKVNISEKEYLKNLPLIVQNAKSIFDKKHGEYDALKGKILNL